MLETGVAVGGQHSCRSALPLTARNGVCGTQDASRVWGKKSGHQEHTRALPLYLVNQWFIWIMQNFSTLSLLLLCFGEGINSQEKLQDKESGGAGAEWTN